MHRKSTNSSALLQKVWEASEASRKHKTTNVGQIAPEQQEGQINSHGA